MILGLEFRMITDENGKRWFRLAPVVREETASDLRFFGVVFAILAITILCVWGLYATEIPPTHPTINITNGEVLQ